MGGGGRRPAGGSDSRQAEEASPFQGGADNLKTGGQGNSFFKQLFPAFRLSRPKETVKPANSRPEGGVRLELLEAVYKRRSIRAYRPERVDRELLDKIIDAGRWAPTAGNNQPWSFIAVDDPGQIEKLKSVSPGMFSRPAFIVAVCANRKMAAVRMGPQGELLALMDICMAAQNMLLAACAMGLGACVVRSFHRPAAGVLLGCPEEIVPELLVAGGYPVREAPVPRRKELDEIRFYGRWGEK